MNAARLASAMLVPVLLAACASPAPPAPPTRDPAPERTATVRPKAPTQVTQPTPPPPTRAPREQVLRLPLTEPPTIDPGLAEDNVSVEIVAQIFEGLVGFDDQGHVRGLGAERWEVSPDGLTYTFTLRQDARWSDGRPVTAHDYAWAWRRNLNPATGSPYAASLFILKNGRAIGEGQLAPEQLGVQVRDDRTLIATLEQPAAYFLRLASTWALMPLRRDVLERFGPAWTEPANVVSNGPFRLREWLHDERIVLERDGRYWGDQARLQQAVYRIFPEGGSDQVLTAYEAGELDATGGAASFELSPGQAARVAADPVLGREIRVFGQSATMFLVVNTRRPHLQDPRVRLALGQALERRKILDEVFKRPGQPAAGLQPEGIAGRQPALWPREDLATARRLLAEAGFPDGRGFPELTFTYNNSAQWKLLAEHLQHRWRDALGIRLRTEPQEWPNFLRFTRSDEWAQRGDLYRGGWFSDYEDPHNWYNLLWDSRHDPRSLSTGWRNDQYDALVRSAAATGDPVARAALYARAEEILAREYPAIPILHFAARALVKPYVQGFEPDRLLGIAPLRRVSLTD